MATCAVGSATSARRPKHFAANGMPGTERATNPIRCRCGPLSAVSVASPGRQVSNLEKEVPDAFVARPWLAHSTLMNALLVTLLLAAPWLAAIAYTWSRAPRLDGPPPSMADRERARLWS